MTCSDSFPILLSELSQLMTLICRFHNNHKDLTWYSCTFNCHLGHGGLQTASEVKFDLKFEISDPNYLPSNMHMAP